MVNINNNIPEEWRYPLKDEQLAVNWEVKAEKFLNVYDYIYQYSTIDKVFCIDENNKRHVISKSSLSIFMYQCGIDVTNPDWSLIEKYF